MLICHLIRMDELKDIITESLDSHIIGFAEDLSLSKDERQEQIDSLVEMKNDFIKPDNYLQAITYLRETGSLVKYFVKRKKYNVFSGNVFLEIKNEPFALMFSLEDENDALCLKLAKEESK